MPEYLQGGPVSIPPGAELFQPDNSYILAREDVEAIGGAEAVTKFKAALGRPPAPAEES